MRPLAGDHGTERQVARDGTDRTRVVLPPRRRVIAQWPEGVDLGLASTHDGDPDYIEADTPGAEAVASTHDAMTMEGLVRLVYGPHRPIVSLPPIRT